MPKSRSLSPRQEQVLQALCAGLTSSEISTALGISPTTLKQHRAALQKRLGARTLIHAAALYSAAPHTTLAAPSPPVPLAPLVPSPCSPQEAFWSYVERRSEGCWIWQGPRSLCGAGWVPRCYMRALRPLGRSARRIAYCLARGVRLPSTVVVLPSCPQGNRCCVNPDHCRVAARGPAPAWRRFSLEGP